MREIKKTLVCACGVLFLCSHGVQGSGNALKQEAWKEMCATAKQLRAVATEAKTKLKKAHSNHESLINTALRLEAIAATKSDATEAAVIAQLAAELKTSAADNSAAIPNLQEAAIKATAATSAVYGGITEFLNLLTAALTGTTNGCLNSNAGGTLMSTRTELTDCPIDKAIDLTDTSTDLAATFSAAGITTLKTADVKDASTNTNKCVLFQQQSDAPTKLFRAAATFYASGGTLKIATATPALATNHAGNINNGVDGVGSALIKQAHAATRHLLSLTAPDDGDPGKATARQLAESTEFAEKVATKLKHAKTTISAATLQTNTKAKIKELLDDGKANFDTKWKELIDTKIYDGKSDETKTEKASSITSTKDLIQSVLYYQNKQKTDFLHLQKELEQKKNDCEKKTEEVCNAIEGEQECNNTKDCHYDSKKDGKKCTLKKEIKEKLEKENQETGGKDGKPDCSKLDTQEKCEAANTAGKPATCGWRKEGDSDTDKDTEKC